MSELEPLTGPPAYPHVAVPAETPAGPATGSEISIAPAPPMDGNYQETWSIEPNTPSDGLPVRHGQEPPYPRCGHRGTGQSSGGPPDPTEYAERKPRPVPDTPELKQARAELERIAHVRLALPEHARALSRHLVNAERKCVEGLPDPPNLRRVMRLQTYLSMIPRRIVFLEFAAEVAQWRLHLSMQEARRSHITDLEQAGKPSDLREAARVREDLTYYARMWAGWPEEPGGVEASDSSTWPGWHWLAYVRAREVREAKVAAWLEKVLNALRREQPKKENPNGHEAVRTD